MNYFDYVDLFLFQENGDKLAFMTRMISLLKTLVTTHFAILHEHVKTSFTTVDG